ncbi:MAG TPA: CmcI family methyltransferase [Candidatus Dormibacteraeota bacterium]|jgi:cephalosporin hydroxylase|nr:CmcI family methyltransferase [Candidatus Dormibacteraeota bacterium]
MRQALASRISSFLYDPDASAAEKYHTWYYNTKGWERTSWMGVTTYKSPADMWNYQEILFSLKPALVIEFGTAFGGSALFFASVMRQIGNRFKIFSVDINFERVDKKAKLDSDIELLTMSSTNERVAARVTELRHEFPGPAFAILDSDHRKNHVLQELKTLRPLLVPGDYMIVEDSNINGHPVLPGWGPGPFEAMEEYFRSFPDDYGHDIERENKFGFTFAPNGFLIRR